MLKTILLAGASALACAGAAEAGAPTIFDYTGGVQIFIAPTAGTYEFEVFGAQGGGGVNAVGGLGASVFATQTLSAGQGVYVVAGGQGANGALAPGLWGGGGGGWSAVADSAGFALAGGGGGAGFYGADGGPGQAGPNGQAGYGPGGGTGGGGGAGGGGGMAVFGFNGGGGSGVLSNGGPGYGGGSGGGGAYLTGGYGDYGLTNGGFGGGGAGGFQGGGGGGGFSGGGGGSGYTTGGGGGGSFAAGFGNVVSASGVNPGNGYVEIFSLGVPEPSTWAMMLGGFGLIGYVLRRRILRAA